MASSDGAMPQTLKLEVPDELLPAATDALRWKALRAHYLADGGRLKPPADGGSLPLQPVPASHVEAYCKGDLDALPEDAKAFMFVRKVLLLLVGGEDLLKSVVDTGKFRGKNVISKLDEALDRVLLYSGGASRNENEIQFYERTIGAFRRLRRSEQRARRWWWLTVLTMIMWFLVWYFGVITLEEVLPTFAAEWLRRGKPVPTEPEDHVYAKPRWE
jgi:hypothetical protein